MFTGNLEAEVERYPEFDGLEKHLLKAQIVRIAYNTVLVPNEMFVKNDETGVVEHKDMEDGPFVPPNFEAIGNPETWIHMNPNILTSGRVTNYRPSDKTEEDFEEENGKLNEIE